MIESSVGNTPVDIAGFCGKANIVLLFAEFMINKVKTMRAAAGLPEE